MSEHTPAYVCLNCNTPCYDIRYGVCEPCGDKVVTSGRYVWNPDIPQKRWRVTPHPSVFSLEFFPIRTAMDVEEDEG